MLCSRFLSLSCALAGLTASALASYDLMYLPDAAGDRIHRFDPVNRVYMGSMNTFLGGGKAAVSPSGQKVASQSSIISEFSTATGTQINSIALAQSRGLAYIDENNLRYVSGAFVHKVPTAGSISFFTPTSGLTPLRALDLPNGNVFVVHENVAGDLIGGIYTNTGTVVGSQVTLAAAVNVAAAAAIGSISFSESTFSTDPLFFTYRGTGGLRLARVNVNSTFTSLTSPTSYSLGGYAAVGTGTSHNVMAGHAGMHWVVGADLSVPSSTRITGIMPSSTVNIQEMLSYTTTSIAVPNNAEWSGGNVVAPEPGSLLAMAVGAGSLLRRRSKG